MKFNQLTTRQVEKIKRGGERGHYHDGSGLYLVVSKWGTPSWVQRYTYGGRVREMGLGSAELVSLKEARGRSREIRDCLFRGDDPIELRRAKIGKAKAEAAKRITFEKAADEYIRDHAAEWSSAKHAKQWRQSLELYAYPVIGKLSVSEIELAHAIKVLKPIWTTKHVMASHVRGRCERILAWAKVAGFREGDNPFRWQGNLAEALPGRPKPVKHHAAMNYEQVPAFAQKLRAIDTMAARALEFAILTAARPGEVVRAKWSEIDLGKALWIAPAEHMKEGRKHIVPLSRRAFEILSELPDRDGKLFPGVHDDSLRQLVKKMGEAARPHGFRSSFRDWAGDKTTFEHEVIEFALAHHIPDSAAAAYRRYRALEKRGLLMQAWANYCDRVNSGNVVQIGPA